MASTNRYGERFIAINREETYSKLFENRGVKGIRQYTTAIVSLTDSPDIETTSHVWKVGDHYWKLAQKHYGDPTLWWIIAFYNNRPTEAHVAFGTVIQIPMPLDAVLSAIEV